MDEKLVRNNKKEVEKINQNMNQKVVQKKIYI